jgi:hypothetical protein
MSTPKEYSTTYTGSSPVQDDDLSAVQPDLADETYPGANNGDAMRSSQLETVRDKADAAARLLGDSANSPAGSVVEILGRDHINGDATRLRLRKLASDPTPAADKAFLYAKEDGGVTKLFMIWSNGTVAELGGGGVATVEAYEDAFESTGSETPGDPLYFTLTETPRGGGTYNTPSGYDIHVYRSGVKMDWEASPTLINHYTYDNGTNRIQVVADGSVYQYLVTYSH